MYSRLLKSLENRYAAKQQNVRNSFGVFAGVAGLLSNAFLFAAKLVIGLLSGSVSIMADAVNNLSDTASSILTLVGFHISGKPADNKHPYGHERFEYISGMVVSILIVFVGGQFLLTSVDKIRNPESVTVSPIVLVVLALSILVKVGQSLLYREVGKKIDSTTLIATAKDSLNDVFTTIAVLIGAAVEGLSGLQIDGFVGLAIAVYIIISGIRLIVEFINELMGIRPSQKMIDEMEFHLSEFPDIKGYHDLLIHRYGSSYIFASVHIEIDESWALLRAHEVIDAIEKDFRRDLQVDLVCHLDPIRVEDKRVDSIQGTLSDVLSHFRVDLKLHDFHMTEDEEGRETLHFDLVLPQKSEVSKDEILEYVRAQAAERLGEFVLNVNFDSTYLL